MLGGVSSSLSGLNSAALRLATAGENIAKANVEGVLPARGAKTGAYLPKDVIDTALTRGGVMAEAIARQPGTYAKYSPQSSKANEKGFVAAPDVRVDEELVDAKLAGIQYTANAKMIKAQIDNEKKLLDVLA